MHWLKAFHVIGMVCWFAGLFYLPRLFVYHASCFDEPGKARFKIMEHKLYYYIAMPSAIVTTVLGLALFLLRFDHYADAVWLYVKMALVVGLWWFHLYCGCLLKQFKTDTATHTERFYRIINEIPTVALLGIVILSFVKPAL